VCGLAEARRNSFQHKRKSRRWGNFDGRVTENGIKGANWADFAATGIDEIELLGLLMKLIYTGHRGNCRQFLDAIKLPYHIVAELVAMAVERRLLRALGMRDSNSPIDMNYALTDEGKRWTIDALERLRYAGPALNSGRVKGGAPRFGISTRDQRPMGRA
jgi:hypothetical protein